MMQRMRLVSLLAVGSLTLTLIGCNQDERHTNTAPFAEDDFARASPRTAVDIDVSSNDQDIDGNLSIPGVVSQPANAHAEVVGNRIRVTPDSRFTGRVTFEYEARDTDGATATARVTVEFLPMVRAIVTAGFVEVGTPLIATPWDSRAVNTSSPQHKLSRLVQSVDGRTVLLIMKSGVLLSIWRIHPRASTLADPVILMRDELLGGVLLSDDGSRAIVARLRDAAAHFDLLLLDTADGRVVRQIDGGNRRFWFLNGRVETNQVFVTSVSPGVTTPIDGVADFATQSISEASQPQLQAGNERLLTYDGQWLFMHGMTRDLVAQALAQPGQLQTLWSAAVGESLVPLSAVPNSPYVIVQSRHAEVSPAADRYELWIVDPAAPASRRRLADLVAGDRFSMRPDGQRMMFLQLDREQPYELSLPDGTFVSALLPASDPDRLRNFRYVGTLGNVAIEWLGPVPPLPQCFVVLDDERGTKHWLGQDVGPMTSCAYPSDTDGYFLPIVSIAETPALSMRAHVVDLREPRTSTPLAIDPTSDFMYIHGVYPIDTQ